MNINFTAVWPYLPQLFKGVLVTLQVAAMAAIGGTVLGFGLSMGGRKGSPVRLLVKGIVDFFRGTPLLIQLTFFHIGLPQITGWIPTLFVSALIVFSLNSGAYLSEILQSRHRKHRQRPDRSGSCLGRQEHGHHVQHHPCLRRSATSYRQS